MKRNLNKALGIFGILSVLACIGATPSFAATTTNPADYGYLKGQKDAQARNIAYAEASKLSTDAEKKAYLNARGIAETPYSEVAKASYSYVTGQKNGKLYEDDSVDKTGYNYVQGQTNGASHRK